MRRARGVRFWKLRPLQVAVTLVMTLLFALVLIALVVSGPLADAIGKQIGLGDTAVTVWSIAKWPVLAFIVSLMLATLYYAAAQRKSCRGSRGSRQARSSRSPCGSSPRSASSSTANKLRLVQTRPTAPWAARSTLLVWVYISNIAVLFGQELNAEVERGRQLAAGKPAVEDIQLPLA